MVDPVRSLYRADDAVRAVEERERVLITLDQAAAIAAPRQARSGPAGSVADVAPGPRYRRQSAAWRVVSDDPGQLPRLHRALPIRSAVGAAGVYLPARGRHLRSQAAAAADAAVALQSRRRLRADPCDRRRAVAALHPDFVLHGVHRHHLRDDLFDRLRAAR